MTEKSWSLARFSRTATARCNIGVARLLPIAGPSVLTTDEAFVGSLYSTFLGRLGTLAELDAYVAKLPASAVPASPRHLRRPRSMMHRVNGLYKSLLHRAADPGGLALYTARLGRGATVASVAEALIVSPEYYATAGTSDPVQTETNDLAFVRSLYTNILGRTASRLRARRRGRPPAEARPGRPGAGLPRLARVSCPYDPARLHDLPRPHALPR